MPPAAPNKATLNCFASIAGVLRDARTAARLCWRRGVCAHLWTAPTDRRPSKLASCLHAGWFVDGAILRVQLLLAKPQPECVNIAELIFAVDCVCTAKIESLAQNYRSSQANAKLTYRWDHFNSAQLQANPTHLDPAVDPYWYQLPEKACQQLQTVLDNYNTSLRLGISCPHSLAVTSVYLYRAIRRTSVRQ